MLSHDECLKLLRKQLPKAAIMSSNKLKNGMYDFVVAKHGQVIKGDLTRVRFAVDPENGKIWEHGIPDDLDLYDKDPEASKGYWPIEGTTQWIDATPEEA